ncbi:MAG: histidine kinase [Acidimicrobiales bacterium]
MNPGSRSRALFEVALVAGVGLIELGVTAIAAPHQPEMIAPGPVGMLLLAAGVASLPFRHRWPVAVLAFTQATTLLYWSLGYARGPIFLALIVALVQAVLTGHRRAALAAVVFGFVAFPWLGVALGRNEPPTVAWLLFLAAWLTVLLSVAETVRSRRDRARAAAESRAEAARRQATEERLRIARELHDSVAHNLSLINIQAGVALHLIDERPEQAHEALATVKQASKEALVELRSILGVLRQDDESAPRAPTPTLRRLDDLVERAGASGLDVHVEVDADLDAVPRNVDLAAFRIIQESLTNVTRHSDRPEATVRIRTVDGALGVEIADEGSGRRRPAPTDVPGGHGIIGMRERAASVGGRLEAGPRPGRGFAVRAVLPLGGDEP